VNILLTTSFLFGHELFVVIRVAVLTQGQLFERLRMGPVDTAELVGVVGATVKPALLIQLLHGLLDTLFLILELQFQLVLFDIAHARIRV
jgi:hypothetical protein